MPLPSRLDSYLFLAYVAGRFGGWGRPVGLALQEKLEAGAGGRLSVQQVIGGRSLGSSLRRPAVTPRLIQVFLPVKLCQSQSGQ